MWTLCHYASHFNVVMSLHADNQQQKQQSNKTLHVEVGPIERRMEDRNQFHSWSDDRVPGQCLFGQLTDKGRETLYEIGKKLRKIYVDEMRFLPVEFSDSTQKSFYLRTTDYPRTMESLQHLLGGLYPPQTRTSHHPPIVHTRQVL